MYNFEEMTKLLSEELLYFAMCEKNNVKFIVTINNIRHITHKTQKVVQQKQMKSCDINVKIVCGS